MQDSRDHPNESRQAGAAQAGGKYHLHLYIAGSSPRSQLAVVRIKTLCEALKDRCELKIVDIFQQPLLAKVDQIVAVPTLVKKAPDPVRLFVGDMSDSDTILACLTS